MAGLLKTQLQLGDSATPANNFTLDSSADNGTMKLSRGDFGATTQDILSIAASGAIDFPALAKSLGTPGYYTLPGGLIIQWGSSTSTTVTFPIAFPTACLIVNVSGQYDSTAALGGQYTFVTSATTTAFATRAGGVPRNYIAIGY